MTNVPTDQEVVAGVTDTLLNYCQFLDEKRLDDWIELFTEDCVFIEGPPATGRAHIRRRVRKVLDMFDGLSHHLSNIRVYRTGPHSADAMSYIYAWHDGRERGHLEIWGRYIDSLCQQDGRWLFSRREVRVQGWTGDQDLGLDRVPQQVLPSA